MYIIHVLLLINYAVQPAVLLLSLIRIQVPWECQKSQRHVVLLQQVPQQTESKQQRNVAF